MKKNDFFDQYKDPKWQKKRLEIMSRDNFQCQNCYDDSNTLNVHHRYYIQNTKPWEYPEELLITLCEECHKSEEECKSIQSDFTKVLISDGYLNHQLITLLDYVRRLPFGDHGLSYILDAIQKYETR
jgi:5-methylcytosine-specific restriction endonuclease McrA